LVGCVIIATKKSNALRLHLISAPDGLKRTGAAAAVWKHFEEKNKTMRHWLKTKWRRRFLRRPTQAGAYFLPIGRVLQAGFGRGFASSFLYNL